MKMTIKLFAILREISGQDEIHLEVPQEISCGEILSHVREKMPRLIPLLERCLIAVNGRYADQEAYLTSGDEVAILPPVSGG